jgi:hypothetical protein
MHFDTKALQGDVSPEDFNSALRAEDFNSAVRAVAVGSSVLWYRHRHHHDGIIMMTSIYIYIITYMIGPCRRQVIDQLSLSSSLS